MMQFNCFLNHDACLTPCSFYKDRLILDLDSVSSLPDNPVQVTHARTHARTHTHKLHDKPVQADLMWNLYAV
jgi:hypothetical protein